MALTDLTGTKWRWNDELLLDGTDLLLMQFYAYDATAYEDTESRDIFEISVYGVNAGHLNFASNNETFVGFLSGAYIPFEEGNFVQVYSAEWLDQAYRIFEITGGTDATNTDLIAFIQSNAEQVIDSPVLPSFSDVEVTPHEGYITMTINGVDFNLKTEASVSLISFSIGRAPATITYQAEEGMTWTEWCASAYNTSDLYVDGSYVTNGALLVSGRRGYVNASDEIISMYNYTMDGGGSAD